MTFIPRTTEDSQAVLDEEVRQEPGVEQEEAPAPEAQGETTVAPETTEETPESKGPKKKGGFQKKIDRLVSRTTELESELEAERRATAELRARLDGKSETKQPEQSVPAGKPQPGQFSTVEEYVDALTDWKLAQKEAKEAQEAAAEIEREDSKAYARGLAEIRAEHEDFDEVVGQSLPIADGVITAIRKLPNGPEVAYFLGKNPDVCEALAEDDWMVAIAKVGQISAELSKGQSNSQATPTQRTVPPKPVRPVGGASSRSSITLDQLSGADYVRVRNAEARAKGRRF